MDAQQLHPTVVGLARQLHAPLLQQPHAMVGIPLREDVLALVIHRFVERGQQLLRLFRRDLLEQRRMQQRVLVIGDRVRCRHCQSLLLPVIVPAHDQPNGMPATIVLIRLAQYCSPIRPPHPRTLVNS